MHQWNYHSGCILQPFASSGNARSAPQYLLCQKGLQPQLHALLPRSVLLTTPKPLPEFWICHTSIPAWQRELSVLIPNSSLVSSHIWRALYYFRSAALAEQHLRSAFYENAILLQCYNDCSIPLYCSWSCCPASLQPRLLGTVATWLSRGYMACSFDKASFCFCEITSTVSDQTI